MAENETDANELQGWCPDCSPYLIAAAVMIPTFMEVLDTAIATVTLPHIAGSLSATTDEATWVLTSYLVANAVVLPASGWFSLRFGRRNFLVFCIIVAAVIAAQQDYQAKRASVRQAEANNNKAQTDVERYRGLVVREEISKEQFDTVVATAKTQAATVDASQSAARASQKAIDEAREQLLQAQSKQDEANKNAPRSVAVRRAQLAGREAAVLAAKAQMGQAQLNLSYTKIFAPVAGVISEKAVEVAQRIQPGEELFTISQLDDIWITANFKETQLRKMHPGEHVDIHVDAYGRTFHGYVENMPGATGAVASLLPPENATGNFVKVVQRLPVRIRLNQGEDPNHLLRLGMSVEPKVWLR